MKTKAYFIFVLIIFSLGGLVSFISSVKGKAICTGDNEYGQGLASLGSYKLIKDYRISLKGGDPPPAESFMISLKAGLKYRLLPINNSANKKKMIMTIYLNEQKSMILATTFSKITGKHYPLIDLNCKTTGTFYLFFEFEEGEKGCGVGLFTVEN